MSELRVALIANPDNRRAGYFVEACRKFGAEPRIISWLSYLSDRDCELPEADLLRIESPGENFEVERALIALGADDCRAEGRFPCLAEGQPLSGEPGVIQFQRQWFLGFSQVLDRLSEKLQTRTALRVMNTPEDIRVMFDKIATIERLTAAGVPTPEFLGRPANYGHFIELLDLARCNRAFLKPAHGSSASGVVAFERSGSRMRATTSALLERTGSNVRLRNVLGLRRYEELAEITDLVNAVAAENAIAERWFPKASFQGKVFDLRVVVIGGSASHIVVRTSRSPITNLHLGNRRGDVEAVREYLGDARWRKALAIAEQAAAVFPQSLYMGVDLMVGTRADSYAVAEVNAFGDLLPNVFDKDGNDTYDAELKAALA